MKPLRPIHQRAQSSPNPNAIEGQSASSIMTEDVVAPPELIASSNPAESLSMITRNAPRSLFGPSNLADSVSMITRNAPRSFHAPSIDALNDILSESSLDAFRTRAKQESKHKYYTHPPVTERRPASSYQYCGEVPKLIAGITNDDAVLFTGLMCSEQMVMMQILANLYNKRLDAVAKFDTIGRMLGNCDVPDYHFTIRSVYEALAIRCQSLRQAKDGRALDYDFSLLPADEEETFKKWLMKIGCWHPLDGEANYTLWKIESDDDGNEYLQIQNNELTVNYMQLLNAVDDNLKAWKKLYHGVAFIKHTSLSSAYQFC